MNYSFAKSLPSIPSYDKCTEVPEIQITTLIVMLMMQAIKLDNIVAEGDASTQKILQVGPSNQTKTDRIKR
ncbi:hypothetical protein SDJN03_27270, partial [Cucurbita argyrosperma subsp. sororia]